MPDGLGGSRHVPVSLGNGRGWEADVRCATWHIKISLVNRLSIVPSDSKNSTEHTQTYTLQTPVERFEEAKVKIYPLKISTSTTARLSSNSSTPMLPSLTCLFTCFGPGISHYHLIITENHSQHSKIYAAHFSTRQAASQPEIPFDIVPHQ